MIRLRTLLLGISVLAFAGCSHFHPPGTAQASGSTSRASKSTSKDQLSSAIATAAKDAGDSGMTEESLMFQEKLYKEDPRDPEKIIAYARALRHAGQTDNAILVIRTPAKAPRASEPLLTEAAYVLISGGKYDEALGFAQKALEKDDKSPDAHHALALALSGLDKHEDAELQFRKALELWPETRDKTPIINNLAMSLAAQGKISEARDIMSQATGEALQSAAYQNNRALLDSLKDRDIRAEKLESGTRVQSTTEVTSIAPTNLPPARRVTRGPKAKMMPIVE